LKIVQYPFGSELSHWRVLLMSQSVLSVQLSPMCGVHPTAQTARAAAQARGERERRARRISGRTRHAKHTREDLRTGIAPGP